MSSLYILDMNLDKFIFPVSGLSFNIVYDIFFVCLLVQNLKFLVWLNLTIFLNDFCFYISFKIFFPLSQAIKDTLPYFPLNVTKFLCFKSEILSGIFFMSSIIS